MDTTTKTKTKTRKWHSKTGAKPVPKWNYGKDSELLLCVKISGHFIPNYGSLDVRSKYRTGQKNEYTTTRKVELLKALFSKGGTRGKSFNPAAVEFAAICPNNGGSGMADLRQALEVWTPGSGWQPNQKPEPAHPASSWRVWLAGTPKNITINFEDIKPGHQGFCDRLLSQKAHLVAKYVDKESGEIPVGFMIACHLAAAAISKLQSGTYTRCYIYNNNSTNAICRVDLGTGRLMGFNAGSGWAPPELFQTI